ncbi:MAG: DUF2752 domain-containing protein [Oscillospiraceae bacterium]|nr:DUF2752 domain-containing protein [Oscillospiraceae bacterium]
MKRKIVIICVSLGVLGIGLFLAWLVSLGFKVYCPFHVLTGLQCPGCGNTRATMALLRLDFRTMFYYNLLYPLEMLYIFRIYATCSVNYIRGGRFAYRTKPDWIDIACLVLILVWTVVRNCTPLY